MAEETTTRRRMEELRVACEREIRIQRQRAGLTASSSHQPLQLIRPMTAETLENRGQEI